MPEQPRFYALEGLRGVGKTTIAPLLAEAVGATLAPTVPPAYQEIRRHVDARQNPDARMCLYLSALLEAAERIRDLLAGGQSVVVESYFARCLTTHKAIGARLGVILPAHIPHPTLFRLVCHEGERQRRLARRAKPVTHWDALAEGHTEAISRAYDLYSMQTVDTTGRTPDQVVAAILRHAKEAIDAHEEPVGRNAHVLPPVHQGTR